MKFIAINILISCSLAISIIGQSLFTEINEETLTGKEIVASIDTVLITAEEFFYNYEFGPAFTKRNRNSKSIHLDFMINEKLLAIEAEKNNLLDKPNVKNIYDDFTADIATEELFRNEILPEIIISDNEIHEVVKNKETEVEFRWLFSKSKEEIDNFTTLLNNKISFDSLFSEQLFDSIMADERRMKTSLFSLSKKNRALLQILDTLELGNISAPINVDDGWYLIKYDARSENTILSETKLNKYRKEAKEVLVKSKMDSLSDRYVNRILYESNSVIKRNGFNILRTYLGKFVLPKEKYERWELDDKLKVAMVNLNISKNEKDTQIDLIQSKNNTTTVKEFLHWFNNRSKYIKFNTATLKDFSLSIENLVWLMKRDKLLSEIAKKKNYYANEWVELQSKWWKEKILYSALRNEYENSIRVNTLESNIVNTDQADNVEKMSNELLKKIFHKVNSLKKKCEIKIYQSVLDQIKVSTEGDKKAINFYSIKKGGLIPRPTFPSIDPDWVSWL